MTPLVHGTRGPPARPAELPSAGRKAARESKAVREPRAARGHKARAAWKRPLGRKDSQGWVAEAAAGPGVRRGTREAAAQGAARDRESEDAAAAERAAKPARLVVEKTPAARLVAAAVAASLAKVARV